MDLRNLTPCSICTTTRHSLSTLSFRYSHVSLSCTTTYTNKRVVSHPERVVSQEPTTGPLETGYYSVAVSYARHCSQVPAHPPPTFRPCFQPALLPNGGIRVPGLYHDPRGLSHTAGLVCGRVCAIAFTQVDGMISPLRSFGSHICADAYVRKFDVVNRGFGGYNAPWALAAFRQVRLSGSIKARYVCAELMSLLQLLMSWRERSPIEPTIRLLTVWLGANDSVLEWKKQHVPLDIFEATITQIIRIVASPSSEYYCPETKIILLTPPPVNTHQRAADLASRGSGQPLDRDFHNTALYAEAVRDVAKKEDIPLVDVYTRLWEACGKEEKNLERYLIDGLHVNEEAYGMIYQDILDVIKTHYPELYFENLPPVFPTWDEVDEHDPEGTVLKRIIIDD
ncbi:SGNH hydrolase [Trametopsis cervina]|nr:SGNH hydrolase [Trametopsis cervina]